MNKLCISKKRDCIREHQQYNTNRRLKRSFIEKKNKGDKFLSPDDKVKQIKPAVSDIITKDKF